MGTKSEFTEECTKVKTAAEIDEMVRQARAQPSKSEHDYEDFEGHTQVGNLQALVARTAIDDDPLPVVPRSSSNVMRKTSSHVVPRASGVMPVMAAGSQSDVMIAEPEPLEDISEDVAFEPWEEDQPKPPISSTFAALSAEHAAAVIETVPAPAPALVVESVKSKPQWGALAWVILLVTTIGMGVYGYQRITELEQQLASASAKHR